MGSKSPQPPLPKNITRVSCAVFCLLAILVGLWPEQRLGAASPQAAAASNAANIVPDGTYKLLSLPCRCGGIQVYQMDCVCFDKENNPDLCAAEQAVFNWFAAHPNGPATKDVGKYKDVTEDCQCVIRVCKPPYVGCLNRSYPELATALDAVYAAAQKHSDLPILREKPKANASTPKQAVARSGASPIKEGAKAATQPAVNAKPRPATLKPLLLCWCYSWCPPCKIMEPRFEHLRKEGFDVQVYIVEEYPDVAAKWNVSSCPTMIWLSPDQDEVCRLTGLQDEAVVRTLCKGAAAQ